MFVTIEHSAMLDFMKSLGMNFKEVNDDSINEYVYDLQSNKHSTLVIRIYTSVSKSKSVTRKYGADTIKLCMLDSKHKVFFGKETPTKRMSNWKDYIKEKIQSLENSIKGVCQKCGGLRVERNSVNGTFIGCSNYKLCPN